MVFRFPIDTKSLHLNISNDNEKGHTATVSTCIKQGKSYNEVLAKIFELKECEIDLYDKHDLINQLTKNSKSQVRILNAYVFNKFSVNGEIIECDKQFCVYVKKEIDQTKVQFGRIKLHYPQSLVYEDLDFEINNRTVLNRVSDKIKGYAFLVKAFEYNTETQILNFDVLIVGERGIPYSKVFINEKGAGNKLTTAFNSFNDNYDIENIKVKENHGQIYSPEEYFKHMAYCKKTAIDLVKKYLNDVENIEVISDLYPYSIYDIRYKKNGIIRYGIIHFTNTKKKYFDLFKKQIDFFNDFSEKSHIFLVIDLMNEAIIKEYNIEDIQKMNMVINSIKYIEE